jgi:hypothetical protein
MRACFHAFLLTSLVAGAPAAQGKPDFSGNWVLQDPSPQGADIPQALTISQPVRRTTARGLPMPPVFLDVTIQRHFAGGSRTETYFIGTEAGAIHVELAPEGRKSETRIAMQWDGDRLRIETRNSPKPDPLIYIEHIEVWRLEQQGRLLMTVIDRGSESPGITRTLIYERR